MTMATTAASPKAISPPLGPSNKQQPQQQPQLPPLTTSKSNSSRQATHRGSSSSLLNRRVSSFSSTSHSVPPCSRPMSTVFPAFHSSLEYALVRDFAYPWNHPLHYGPDDLIPTPASERRLSDPEVGGWEDSRSSWSAGPPWMAEDNWSSSKDQLPASTYNDGGPPYSEDDDLHSPIVTTARHRKRSERGRSPGTGASTRATHVGGGGDRLEQYHPTGGDELDGPGGEIETFTRRAQHRDSNFAKPLQRDQNQHDDAYAPLSEEFESDDEARYSKDYSFTIASPDEEMHGKAVALFDFASEHENELELREGQIILVSYRHGQGWLVAEDPVSGESGLVPEEFVRLVKHIEGGLNGLSAVGLDDTEDASPTSNDPGSATTPTATESNDAFEKQPAVQSNFSTSSRDFSPRPRSTKVEQER